MRIKRQPEDFVVEEQIVLPGERGPYAYYRVEKRNASTLAVRDEIAPKLKVTPSNVVFPALKDKTALAVQYASVRKRGPETVKGRNFVAHRVAWGTRALRPSDLRGNRFSILLRDFAEEEASRVSPAMQALSDHGLPNYFDDQRFGSFSTEGFIGKAILMREAERAVWLYLAGPMLGDTREVREFKKLVRTHWGQWGYLLHQAPRPSNFRSVLTFLKDHPQGFRKALNLVHDRLLSIYLVAYQSWVWNQILGRFLAGQTENPQTIRVVGRLLPVPLEVSDILKERELQMPNLTVVYPPDVLPAVEAVLAEEEMTLEDFKARILRRVYLPKGERGMWFAPADIVVGNVQPDAMYAGRFAVTVEFTLDPGQYATLVIKSLAARMAVPVHVR
ncbi:MAG: tRNA pseudouridine(13) synthase TruD [Anaerolineae bacterium]|nr:tRNA pseudouridine(13) synthase TruD [Anaerolineae bacterium]